VNQYGESKKTINPWIIAIRPKTLPAGAAPVILGLTCAYKEIGLLDIPIAIITLFCALCLQISSNLINDYYDGISGIDDGDRLGPPRAVALGYLRPDQVKTAFRGTLLISFLLGIPLIIKGGFIIAVIGVLSLFFAWAYTGGPFPLSRLGLGEIFAFLFFGPIAVYGTWYLQTLILFKEINDFSNPVVLLGSATGLLSATLMGVNNLRDRKNDKSCGKNTLATLLGSKVMRGLIFLFMMTSQFLGYKTLLQAFNGAFHIITLLGPLSFFIFFKVWKGLFTKTDGKDLNESLATVGKYLFLFSLSHSFVLIFSP